MSRTVPFDIHARSKAKIEPIPIEQRIGLLPEIAIRHNELMAEMRRISLASGFGKIVKVFMVTVTTTSVLLKEHSAKDDRLLDIYNHDAVGGNTLLIDIEPEVTIGRPVISGTSFRLVVVPNDRIYARAVAGSIDVRVLEIVYYQAQ